MFHATVRFGLGTIGRFRFKFTYLGEHFPYGPGNARGNLYARSVPVANRRRIRRVFRLFRWFLWSAERIADERTQAPRNERRRLFHGIGNNADGMYSSMKSVRADGSSPQLFPI